MPCGRLVPGGAVAAALYPDAGACQPGPEADECCVLDRFAFRPRLLGRKHGLEDGLGNGRPDLRALERREIAGELVERPGDAGVDCKSDGLLQLRAFFWRLLGQFLRHLLADVLDHLQHGRLDFSVDRRHEAGQNFDARFEAGFGEPWYLAADVDALGSCRQIGDAVQHGLAALLHEHLGSLFLGDREHDVAGDLGRLVHHGLVSDQQVLGDADIELHDLCRCCLHRMGGCGGLVGRQPHVLTDLLGSLFRICRLQRVEGRLAEFGDRVVELLKCRLHPFEMAECFLHVRAGEEVDAGNLVDGLGGMQHRVLDGLVQFYGAGPPMVEFVDCVMDGLGCFG